MPENRILLVLGPAATLYLIADAFVRAGLVGSDAWMAGVAALVSLSPYLVRGVERDEAHGKSRFNWLAESTAVALASSLGADAPHAVLTAILLALVGALVVDLALTVPDRPARFGRLRAVAWVLAILVACLGALARADAFEVFGIPVLLPARFEGLPELALVGFATLALAARLVRRNLGSSPSALAANAWPTAGLFLAVPLLAVEPLLRTLPLDEVDPRLVGAARSTAAAVLVASHAAMIDPRRRPVAGEAIRALVSIAIPLVLAAAVVGAIAWSQGESPLTFGTGAAILVLATRLLERWLRRPVRRFLAPRGGRLLDATDRALAGLERQSELEEVVEITLDTLRERESGVSPWLMLDDPDLIFRVDAAGLLRRERRALPEAIFAALRESGAIEPLLLRDYESRIVREPVFRPLVEEMSGLDAFAAIPLRGDGELQGVLLLTPKANATPPTLEELAALTRLGEVLGARLVSLKANLRAQRRLHEAIEARESEEERVEALREELARLAKERAPGSGEPKEPELVAYSKPMRALMTRLDALAASGQHLTFSAEPGIPTERLAFEIHRKTYGETHAPFVAIDCTLTPPEDTLAALLGKEGDDPSPGWLTRAHGGTLCLVDVAALPLDAQRELAEALSQKLVRPLESTSPHDLELRVIACTSVSLERLADQGLFDRELLRWLTGTVVRIPPLRERLDDLPSLVWAAIARACRALGKESVGISEEAMAQLRAYAWPGNEKELHRVIRLAVAAARGEAIVPRDLPPLGRAAEDDPLEGTFAEVERRVLERALLKAGRDKAEAARLLDLKPRSFGEKLRRLGIEP